MGKLFGTDGVRGRANRGLSPELALRLGQAGAAVLGRQKRGKIVVGRDTRISGDLIENAMVAGILSAGADVYKLGIAPSPAVAYLTRAMKADAGIAISASHNPIEDNGIKFFDHAGYKLSLTGENEIEEFVLKEKWDLRKAVGKDVGQVIDIADKGKRKYSDFVLGSIDIDLQGVKVVLDCAYGAAYEIAPSVFREAGAKVRVVNGEPLGEKINVGCGSTNPHFICDTVRKYSQGFGLAFDGDADRVVAADEEGGYVDGDMILAINAESLNRKEKLAQKKIATTVMTNYGFDLAMSARGISIIKTGVGDRNVLEAMKKHKLNLGGEQSGHIIFLDDNTTGDGIMTALKLAAIVKRRGETLRSLSRIMERLPQVLVNVKVNDKDKLEKAKVVWDRVEKVERQLKGHGRVLIRASGTEDLIRVMVEAENEDDAKEISSGLASLVQKELK